MKFANKTLVLELTFRSLKNDFEFLITFIPFVICMPYIKVTLKTKEFHIKPKEQFSNIEISMKKINTLKIKQKDL